MAAPGKKHLHCPDAATLAEALAEKCTNARLGKDGWMACCPSHDDSTASLHISPDTDKVLLHCFAGCATETIMAALGLDMVDLYVQQDDAMPERLVCVYDYLDANGAILHQKLRFEPKRFVQRRPDPEHKGKYIYRTRDIERVLYHLPAILQAIPQETPSMWLRAKKAPIRLKH